MITTEIKKRLNDTAFHNTLQALRDYGNEPQKDIEEALWDIIQTLTKMACGEAEAKYYVSSIDPGLGKTTSIIQWLKVFSSMPEFKDVGALVCFDRHEQIESFITENRLDYDQTAILISNNRDPLGLNKLLTSEPTNSQILVTTKTQILLRSKNKKFMQIEELYYKGKPRTVLIWDESLMVAHGVSLIHSSLGKIFSGVTRQSTMSLSKDIQEIFNEINNCEDGTVYTIPELGISYDHFMGLFDQESDDIQRIAHDFWTLSRQAATIRTNDYLGKTLVDFIEDLSEDFVPCLVTDASARVKRTYQLHSKHRGNLQFLKTASKQYSNLSCYYWNRGSGKSSVRNHFRLFAKEIATIIDSKQEEKFLVVHHKHDHLPTVIKANMFTDKERVSFIHYGIHTATNRYADIPNIILAGTHHYNETDYEAIGRAAANIHAENGELELEEIKEVERGEIYHHFLQAICRGAIRKNVSGNCLTSNLWIIGDAKWVNEESLQLLFPGCIVDVWVTTEKKLTKMQRMAEKEIMRRLDAGEIEIAIDDIMRELGITRHNAFRERILDKPDFPLVLEDLGLEFNGTKGKKGKLLKKQP